MRRPKGRSRVTGGAASADTAEELRGSVPPQVDAARLLVDAGVPRRRDRATQHSDQYLTVGATLGSRVIAKQLRQSVGVTHDRSGGFLHALGDAAGVNWKRVTVFLQTQPAPHEPILGAACNVCALERSLWRCHREARL